MSERCKGGIAGRSWAPWLQKVAFSLFTPTCLFALAVWIEGEVVPVIATVIAHLFVVLAAALALLLRGAGRAQHHGSYGSSFGRGPERPPLSVPVAADISG